MSLHSRYPVYVDPALKKQDKQFTLALEKSLADKGYNIVESEKIEDFISGTLVFVLNNNLHHISKRSIVINCLNHNLDLFGTNEVTNEFELNHESEIENVLSAVSEVVSLNLQSSYQHIFQKSLQKIKNIVVEGMSDERLCFKKELKDEINCLENSPQIIEHLNDVLSHEGKHIQLKYFSELSQVDNVIFLATFEDGIDVFLEYDSSDFKISREDYTLLQSRFIMQKLINESHAEINLAKDIFSVSETPIVITTTTKQMILSNTAFTNLNLSSAKLSKLVDEEVLKINHVEYRVVIREKDNFLIHYFFDFSEQSENSKKATNKELGIVTSSIAHELNNPLAGILAALDVLMLDDYENEIYLKLIEMKKTVTRCKNLVQTFLGFSKLDVKYQRSEELSIEECVKQSIDLIRFRLVESNINMEINFESRENFSGEINSTILVILLYLIFGEYLTEFSHQGLISNGDDKGLALEVIERKSEIMIVTSKKLLIEQAFFESKLFSHLAEEASLHFSLSEKGIIIS